MQMKKWTAAALGVLAFGATLLPVSGIVWLGYFISVSPRFLYIPLLGLALALAALCEIVVVSALNYEHDRLAHGGGHLGT